MSCSRVSLAASLPGCQPQTWLTDVWPAGMPFAFLLGWGLTHLRLHYTYRIASRFRAAKAAGVLRVRHKFFDAQEVEIVARWGRTCSTCHPRPALFSFQRSAMRIQGRQLKLEDSAGLPCL